MEQWDTNIKYQYCAGEKEGWWLLAQFNILVISEFMKSILISVRTFRYLG